MTLPTRHSGDEWEPGRQAAQPLVSACFPSSQIRGGESPLPYGYLLHFNACFLSCARLGTGRYTGYKVDEMESLFLALGSAWRGRKSKLSSFTSGYPQTKPSEDLLHQCQDPKEREPRGKEVPPFSSSSLPVPSFVPLLVPFNPTVSSASLSGALCVLSLRWRVGGCV